MFELGGVWSSNAAFAPMISRLVSPLSSNTAAWATVLVGTLVIGVLDYVTGAELGFFVFYFAPVAFAAWRLDHRVAFGIAALCAAVWFAADVAAGHAYVHPMLKVWDTVIRLSSFLLIGWAVARIRALLAIERETSEALTKALDEVHTLRGLLPMCAWCKQIRDASGEWMPVEKFIGRHSDAEISHSMCETCAQQLLQEADALGDAE
jgi:hypothetical protein